MCLLLADVQVYHSDSEDDNEEYESRSRCTSLLLCYESVDESDHSIKSSRVSRRSHIVAEDTDYRGVFLKSTDEAGDDNVCYHRREKRNCDLGEYTDPGSRVDLSRIVILLVNALKSAEKYEDLERKCVPYYVDDHNEDVRPIR